MRTRLDEPMRIDVTKDDIDHGIPQNPRCCPIALAMKREGLIDPTVCRTAIRWIQKMAGGYQARQVVLLPLEVHSFLGHYDYGRGDFCLPFEFDLPTEMDRAMMNSDNELTFFIDEAYTV